MINQDRVRRMTRMAAYEDNEGKEDSKITRYFRADYLTKQVLITLVSGTLAFLILFAAYAGYHFEEIIEKVYSSNMQGFVLQTILQYAAFIGVLTAVTLVVYGRRYTRASRCRKGFRKDLFQLAMRYRTR